MLDLNHQGYQKTELPKRDQLYLCYWAFYRKIEWTALVFNHVEVQIWNSIQNIVKWPTSVQDPSDPARVPSYFIYLCDRSRQCVDPHTHNTTQWTTPPFVCSVNRAHQARGKFNSVCSFIPVTLYHCGQTGATHHDPMTCAVGCPQTSVLVTVPD